MAEKVSSKDLNNAGDPIQPKPKKKSITEKVFGKKKPQKSRTTDAARNEIINEAISEAKNQGRENVSRQELLKSIAEIKAIQINI